MRDNAQAPTIDQIVDVLRAGDDDMTIAEIGDRLGPGFDPYSIPQVILDAQPGRVEDDGNKVIGRRRFWLSTYERAGLHPNASEAMSWLEHPLPYKYFVRCAQPGLRVALRQLIDRGLIKVVDDVCYRDDRPHRERAHELAAFIRALLRLRIEESRLLADLHPDDIHFLQNDGDFVVHVIGAPHPRVGEPGGQDDEQKENV